jgi:hypothetical protein
MMMMMMTTTTTTHWYLRHLNDTTMIITNMMADHQAKWIEIQRQKHIHDCLILERENSTITNSKNLTHARPHSTKLKNPPNNSCLIEIYSAKWICTHEDGQLDRNINFIQGVSKVPSQQYSKCYYVASVMKAFILKGVQLPIVQGAETFS